ncbi:MAG: YggT family protein [Candidatus Dadabacteria bacterium]|nr:MAG: YggT family protein [Candidatus Dadabacteria bacterium]
MSIIAEILDLLLQFVSGLLQIYVYLVVATVVISWVDADPRNGIVRFIRNVTEPALRPIQRRMWKITRKLQVDLSPIVLIFGISVVQILLRHLRLWLMQTLR